MIKARTVKRRPIEERWSSEAMLEIKAPQRRPEANKTQATRVRRMREEDSRGEQPSAEDSGVMLEEATVARRKLKATDFRITQGMMRKSGRTQGCIGCERAAEGAYAKHSEVCRARFEEVMEQDEVMKERLLNKELRRQAKEWLMKKRLDCC